MLFSSVVDRVPGRPRRFPIRLDKARKGTALPLHTLKADIAEDWHRLGKSNLETVFWF
jgi:hypothetical protein